MSVTVRMADEEDVPAIQVFLDQHWSRGHVLAQDRRLFDFQHRSPAGRVHFAFAEGPDSNGLLGVIGGITNSTYDPDLAAHDTLWLTTWKVREGRGNGDRVTPGLGLRLHRTLAAAVPHRAIGTVGNNETAEAIYRVLGYQTGTLRQFALINPHLDRFRLARVDSRWPLRHFEREPRIRLRPLGEADLRALQTLDLGTGGPASPAKSPRYFVGRYLQHPRYDYQVFGLERGGQTAALLTFRLATHAGARALRLVDFWGAPDSLAGVGEALTDLLAGHQAEYLDFFVHGLDEQALAAAGLSPVDPDGATIVPSYFEPFAQQNVRLRFAFRSASGPSTAGEPVLVPVLVKGDADQDRPNRPPAESAA